MNLFFFKTVLILAEINKKLLNCLTSTYLCLSETDVDCKEVAEYSINFISYDFYPKEQ